MKTLHMAIAGLILWSFPLSARAVAPEWYLMQPPIANNGWDSAAPLSKWANLGTFPSEAQCRDNITAPAMPVISAEQKHKLQGQHLFVGTSTYTLAQVQNRRCVASDDPGLKGGVR